MSCRTCVQKLNLQPEGSYWPRKGMANKNYEVKQKKTEILSIIEVVVPKW